MKSDSSFISEAFLYILAYAILVCVGYSVATFAELNANPLNWGLWTRGISSLYILWLIATFVDVLKRKLTRIRLEDENRALRRVNSELINKLRDGDISLFSWDEWRQRN